MQLSLQLTDFQEQFLTLINVDSRSFYKDHFKTFNISAELNHSVTTAIFNLIIKEISAIKDLIPALIESHQQLQTETKHHKKLLLAPTHHSFKDTILDFQPLLFDTAFDYHLTKVSTPYLFHFNKFTASMNKLFVFMGVYEELYLINTLSLSYGPTHTLSYSDQLFSFSTRSHSVTFTVFPLFFLTKFLLPDISEDNAIRLVIEQFLSFDLHSPNYLVSFADLEQISSFYGYCNMQYLSQLLMSMLTQNKQLLFPTILTSSQLHV